MRQRGRSLAWLLLMHASAVPAIEAERTRVELADTLGQRHVVEAELASTPAARAIGLMFRRHLGEGEGMLFVFAEEKPVRMWMRNTLLPLDMLFFDAEGELLSVHPRCEPLSERLIGPGVPVKAVLELPAGGAARRSLVPGARLLMPDLEGLPAR